MVCVIGAGHLGSSLVRRLADCDIEVSVVDRNKDKCDALAALSGVSVVEHPSPQDIVVLCVKPPDIAKTAAAIALHQPAFIVSVAAGVTIEQIEQAIDGVAVVRAMPNIASSVGEGATGMCANSLATDDQVAMAEKLLSVLGIVERVDEAQIDAVTGLSGSGPAYVFKMCEAMIDGAVNAGLERDVATRLAIATISGAAELLKSSNKTPTELRESVTTPNGTTAAALSVLNERGIDAMFNDAITAAQIRCRELSNG